VIIFLLEDFVLGKKFCLLLNILRMKSLCI
jgi:hypothetical protein